MSKFSSINEVLDFAINNEEEAVKLYKKLAEKMDNQEMKKVFEGFALEEKGHRDRLHEIKQGKEIQLTNEKVIDMKISDYMPNVSASPDMTYDKALIFAMKAEKASFKLYSTLAKMTGDSNLKAIFTSLANEEAKHKLRFELEYEDNFLDDN